MTSAGDVTRRQPRPALPSSPPSGGTGARAWGHAEPLEGVARRLDRRRWGPFGYRLAGGDQMRWRRTANTAGRRTKARGGRREGPGGPGAHQGRESVVGGSRGGQRRRHRWWHPPAGDGEEGHGGGSSGHPGSRGLTRKEKRTARSRWFPSICAGGSVAAALRVSRRRPSLVRACE